jgi:hypothetical protein
VLAATAFFWKGKEVTILAMIEARAGQITDSHLSQACPTSNLSTNTNNKLIGVIPDKITVEICKT